MSSSVVVTPRPNVAVSGNRGGPQGVQGPQGLPGSLFAYVLPQTYGAVGDGVHDDTAAFVAALAAGQHVYAPAGTYKITGFPVPDSTILELGMGAVLRTSGSISLGLGSHFLGRSIFSTNSASPWNANVVYDGPSGGTILKLGVNPNAQAVKVRGVFVDSGGIASVTGCQIGSLANGNSLVWAELEDFSTGRCLNGVVIQSAQEVRLRNLTCYCTEAEPSDGVGLWIGNTAGVVAGIEIDHVLTSYYLNHVMIGDPTKAAGAAKGCFRFSLSGGYMVGLPSDDGCELNLANVTVARVHDVTFDGPITAGLPGGTSRLVKIGSALTPASHVLIEGCLLNGSLALIEGFAWQYLDIRDNYLSVGSGEVAFLNTGGGPVRRFGHYGPNYLVGDASGLTGELSGGTTGFDSFWLSGTNAALFGNRTQPLVEPGKTSDPRVLNPGDSILLVPNGLRCLVDILDNVNAYGRVYVPGDGNVPVVVADPFTKFSTNPNAAAGWSVYWDGSQYTIKNNNAPPLNFQTTVTVV